jgi:hypothetical protein
MTKRHSTVKLMAVVGFFYLVYLFNAGVVLDRFPNSGDEYSYLLQSKIFCTGHLSFPSFPLEVRDFFTLDHVIDDGRVRSKYPPGWPLLLCLGEPLGLSWSINPLLAALTLLFMFHLVAQFLGRKAAWFAIAITGVSPFYLYNSSSFYSHTSALLFLTMSLFFFVHGLQSLRWLFYLLAGMAAGFTFLIRPLDGIVCVAALSLLAFQFKNIRAMVTALGGSIPFAAVFLVYNHLQFGGALVSGYEMYRPTLVEFIGVSNVRPEFSLKNISMYIPHFAMVIKFTEWIVPGAIILFPIGVWHLCRTGTVSARRVLVFGIGFLGLLFVALQFITSGEGDCYGPRYLFAWLIPFGMIAAAGLEFMLQKRKSMAFLLSIMIICLMTAAEGLSLYLNGKNIRDTIAERSRVYKMVKVGNLSRAVVFLRDTDHFPPRWYTRNGTAFQGDIVYVVDHGFQRDRQLMSYYPGYHFYQYRTATECSKKRTKVSGGEYKNILVQFDLSANIENLL